MKILAIKVKPNSSVTEITEKDGLLTVKLRAPAKDGKANQELVKLLSKHFNAEVEIISGKTSSRKLIKVLN